MGMYTELIFGAGLKSDTPEKVINILKYMVRDLEEKPELFDHEFFQCDRWEYLFTMTSYYFGAHRPPSKIEFDDISNAYTISTRANLKNYDGEIEKFCDWIKPYIEDGSGCRDMYAISIYEESEVPTIYYLDKDGEV